MTTQDQIKNAIKWIDGLKNTKLPQGKFSLGNKEDGFCCLGYACEILSVPYNSFDTYSKELPDYVGLKNSTGSFQKLIIGDAYSLTNLNDI